MATLHAANQSFDATHSLAGGPASLPLASMSLQTDRSDEVILGRYRLLRMLWRSNTMFDFYAAEDRLRGTRCTIKVPRQGCDAEAIADRCFAREVELAERLVHPNIATVYGCGQDIQAVPFLVMEPLCGRTLHHLLSAEGALSLDRALPILLALADALQHSHDRGIAHGGLKLGSIFLHEELDTAALCSQPPAVKLLDLGFARDLWARPGARLGDCRSLTQRGVPAYMPPEALKSNQLVFDAKSDQWMLAVIAYRMLTGQLPFFHADPLITCQLVREHDPPRLETLVPALDGAVADAIHKGLSKDGAQRHANVMEFVAALRAAAAPAQVDQAVPETTLHGFRPDLIALCRRDVALPDEILDAAPIAMQEEIITARYEPSVLAERVRASTQPEERQPAPVPPIATRKRRPWSRLLPFGLAIGMLLGVLQSRPGAQMRADVMAPATAPGSLARERLLMTLAPDAGQVPPEGDAALWPLSAADPPGAAHRDLRGQGADFLHQGQALAQMATPVSHDWTTLEPSGQAPRVGRGSVTSSPGALRSSHRSPRSSPKRVIEPLLVDPFAMLEAEPPPITQVEIVD